MSGLYHHYCNIFFPAKTFKKLSVLAISNDLFLRKIQIHTVFSQDQFISEGVWRKFKIVYMHIYINIVVEILLCNKHLSSYETLCRIIFRFHQADNKHIPTSNALILIYGCRLWLRAGWCWCCACHYSDAVMGVMASKIAVVTIVCATVYSGADQRKHRSSASLAFVRGIPAQSSVTRKMFPFNDVIMMCVPDSAVGGLVGGYWLHGSDAGCISKCSCIFQHGGCPKCQVNKDHVTGQWTLIVIRYIPGVYCGRVVQAVLAGSRLNGRIRSVKCTAKCIDTRLMMH